MILKVLQEGTFCRDMLQLRVLLWQNGACCCSTSLLHVHARCPFVCEHLTFQPNKNNFSETVILVLFCPLVFVTEFPLDQDLFVGKSQVIRCSAEGYPKPTFKWYKKRRLVKFSDPRFTLLSNGSMLINPVQELDTAEYICRITQLGETEEGTNLREEKKVIQVTVYGKFALCC